MTGAIITSSGDHYKGFHQCPNVLRDKYMSVISGDGYGFLNYLLSWANTQATLSIRRMKKDLGWSQDKLERVQGLVLTHCSHFVTMTVGDRVNANQWHLDMEKIWLENAMHLAQSAAERLAKRGVPISGTPQKKARKDVPEIGTYKDNDLNTSLKTGGVLDGVGDARAIKPPTPPARVVEPSPAQLTTGNAALQKDFEAVRGLSASVAVLDAPVIDASGDGLISDADLEHLFGSEPQANAELGTVTEVQEVPGGGAGVAALAGPLAGLQASHSPEDTRVALQRALGGPRRLADLLEETPPGLRDGTRHHWVSAIAPERVDELARQGREQKIMHPWTAITQLLDQEIGAKIQRGTDQGGLSSSGSHAPARKAEAPDYSQDQGKYDPGARWTEKATGTVRVLAGLETSENRVAGAGARYKFEDGLVASALILITKYEFQDLG